jgi:hypothetical protein
MVPHKFGGGLRPPSEATLKRILLIVSGVMAGSIFTLMLVGLFTA